MNLYLLIVAVFSGMTFIVSLVGLAVTEAPKTATKTQDLYGSRGDVPSEPGAAGGWNGEMIVKR